MTSDERLKEAEIIIRMLLASLHSHGGGKKDVADKARAFLGLKPGEKIARGEDWWGLRFPK